VLFRGADSGFEGGSRLPYERSLTVEEPLDDDILLAFEMNGSVLPGAHGCPVRLFVPGWHWMASVKWLVEVKVLRAPFKGWFQAARYVYADAEGRTLEPVRQMKPKSSITQPREGARVRKNKPCVVSGIAWSGAGPTDVVEFRSEGAGWRRAGLRGELKAHAWRRWSICWTPRRRGIHTLVSRAQDAIGGAQPLAPVWNLRGYGCNSVVKVKVRVV
jgi:DMSO/TMAO reductase YedYZ molybdopterin-dependent catalytic subunit